MRLVKSMAVVDYHKKNPCWSRDFIGASVQNNGNLL